LNVLRFKPVNPQTVENQVMRNTREISLVRITESDEVVDEVCGRNRGDVETD
jgi:hypothetical protein